METPVLALRRLRYRHANGAQLDLPVPMTLLAGQAAVITGPSGSGKSTLLRALAGCPPEGGEIRWEADQLPERSALALQDPEAQLLCSCVEEEVELGPRNQGLAGEALEARIAAALAALDITPLRRREVHALSMGQKQRVGLSALLAMRPDVLLLDEPFSQLDAPGEQRLRRLIRELKAQGRVVIVSAHEVDPDDPLWDVRVDLAEARACRLNPCLPQPAAAPRASGAGAPVLQAQGLEFRTPSGTAVLAGLDLHLFPGTTTQVAGTNASGKSTLLRCLAGLLTPCAGQVVIDGVTAPRPGRLAGRLGYLPQNADMLLFEESVRREVGFSLRRTLPTRADREARVEEMLGLCGLTELASRPPLCLSHGERHMLALASILAPRPSVVLLDEPLTGLDAPVGRIVLGLLTHVAREHGTAVLLVTHGKLPREWGERRYVLQQGRLHAIS